MEIEKEMKDCIDELYEVIKKYQSARGMSFMEAIGILRLLADELYEQCRHGSVGATDDGPGNEVREWLAGSTVQPDAWLGRQGAQSPHDYGGAGTPGAGDWARHPEDV